MVRRLSSDTRLNGRTFDDALLTPGDRLTIGPVELEVLTEPCAGDHPFLATRTTEPRQPAAAVLPPASEPRHAGPQRDSQRRHEALDPQRAELDQRRGELDRLAETLRRQERVLGQREAELRKREEEVHARERALEQQKALAERRRQELDSHEEALRQKQQDLDRERASWTAARNKGQTEIDARQAELDLRCSELDARQAKLDARQAELDAWRTELEARQAECERRQAELDAREAAIDQRSRRGEADRTRAEVPSEHPSAALQQAGGLHFENPPERAPQSSEELFRRMGMTLPLDDDEQGQQDHRRPDGLTVASQSPCRADIDDEHEDFARPEAAAEPIRPATIARPGHTDDSAEDADSIDDYMSRLLERVRATAARAEEPSPTRSLAEPAGLKPVSSGSADSPFAPPEPAPNSEPPRPGAISPRAVAAEKSVDLGALRDLANLSAQAAISRHARRRLSKLIASKLLVILVSLAAGGIEMWLGLRDPSRPWVLWASAASFAVAAIWGAQYILLAYRMVLAGANRLRRHPSE